MKTLYHPLVAVLASCIAIFLPGALVFGFPGVMAAHWQQIFGVGRAAVGQTLFFVLAAVGIFMFVTGRLQEKIGPAWTMALGAILYGSVTMMVGHASGINWVYLWAFLTGASSAFIYLPTLTVVQRWYPHRRGLVSGLVSMFFGLSGAVMAPVFSRLFQRIGYTALTYTVGIVFLTVGLATAVFIRLPRAASDNNQHPGTDPAHLSLTLGQSLRTRSFWLLWFIYAFVGAAGIAMVTLATSFGLSQGLTMSQAVLLLVAFNITNGASRLVSGFFSDVIGRETIMSTTFLLAGGAYFLLPQVNGIIIWSVLTAVIGFAFGTLFAVSAPLVGDCFGMDHFATIFGLVFTAYGFVSGALGPWLGGYLLDLTQGNFTLVFAYLGALMIVSSIMIWVTTPYTECTV
ncbi:MAG: MFS transporter [Desulfobacterales bacterium]|jgi:OFA family oxalate/formate antiporter-like MFS transporter